MDPQDFFRWGVLRNQSRQNQLLEEINWRMMSPAERAAASAQRERDRQTKAYALIGSVAFFGLLYLAAISYNANWEYRQNSPLTAKQVRSVIETRKKYWPENTAEGPGKIAYDNGVLKSERRLTDDALEFIASSDVDFHPQYGLFDDEVKILCSKTKGWVIVKDVATSFGPFMTSEANIWLKDCTTFRATDWRHHRGELRITETYGARLAESQKEGIASLKQNGKRVTLD